MPAPDAPVATQQAQEAPVQVNPSRAAQEEPHTAPPQPVQDPTSVPGRCGTPGCTFFANPPHEHCSGCHRRLTGTDIRTGVGSRMGPPRARPRRSTVEVHRAEGCACRGRCRYLNLSGHVFYGSFNACCVDVDGPSQQTDMGLYPCRECVAGRAERFRELAEGGESGISEAMRLSGVRIGPINWPRALDGHVAVGACSRRGLAPRGGM